LFEGVAEEVLIPLEYYPAYMVGRSFEGKGSEESRFEASIDNDREDLLKGGVGPCRSLAAGFEEEDADEGWKLSFPALVQFAFGKREILR
jgi:hypothetical protein